MSSKNNVLTTVGEVEGIVGTPPAVILLKQLASLDEGCRTILAASPVAAFGYRGGGGTSRTTFVGGRPGFARVHSPTRLSFALTEPGEPHGPASLFFLLPGVGELLRVNGSVVARRGGRVVVDVAEAYVHCAQAVLRSRLWQPPAPPAPAADAPVDGPLSRPGVAGFLAAAPFLALSTWDTEGGSDTSPRGDRGAVARIRDGRTLVLPDRRGNKRADTLHNLLRDDRLSLAALVPGRDAVLHVRGRGAITDDPALLATMALRGTPPHLALIVDVEDAELVGGGAVGRARLWSPGTHLDRRSAPDLMAIGGRHLAAGTSGASSVLLRGVASIPGIGRMLRGVMNRAYRSGLRKEGYDDVSFEAGGGAANPQRSVRVTALRRETPSAVTLVLEDGAPFDFRPGQFFTLVADVGGRPLRRAYSASSAPGSSRLEVTVKRVEGGRFSAFVHRDLRVGDHLALRGPSGSFSAEPGELVFVAAGSGVTPIMSMIRAMLERSRIALLYSSRTAEEVIFGAELARLAREHPDRLSVTHVLTSRDGRLDADGVRRWIAGVAPTDDARYYVCGPEPLMDEVVTGLGVPPDRVHRERYRSGTEVPVTAARRLTVENGGRPVGTVVVAPGQTLLDAGLGAGFAMPYSCTVGNCGDCLVRLVDGEVAQSEPNCLTPRQRADGYVLACVSCPLSEVRVDIAEP
ncbi:2Fe-2S iron-sulfur cluster-binding protein [Cryptosporangium japonicum]|uniref:2Fe-2S iron-sulfur cluster binding domain-containing protein n=1 Tax=Cryptosporangium japonicum TaxID=80872 RepID=A0ABP3DR59_9ACTN